MYILARTKRLVLCGIAIIVLLAVRPDLAHAQFGIAVGLNFDSIGDVDRGDTQATFDNATGYHLGVFYDLALGPVAVRPGVFLRRVQDVDLSAGLPGTPERDVFSLTMIEVPLDLRYRIPFPVVTPYALAGPVFGFASTDNERLSDAFADLTISGSIGIGAEISLPGFTPKLYPEIRYAFGLSRFVKEEWTFGDTTITAEDSQKLSTFMLRLGFTF